MRFFEVLLCLVCVYLVLIVFFQKLMPDRFRIAAVPAALLVLAAQLIIEGYRWQLFMIYIFVILFSIIFILQYARPGIKIWKPLRYILLSITAIIYSLSVLLAILLPVVNFDKPNGPYAVGCETHHFIDNDRFETLTEDKYDKRELMATIYYPANVDENSERKTFFPKEKDAFDKYMAQYARDLKFPKFIIGYWKYFKSNSIIESNLASGSSSYPVIILCHGMGTGGVLHTIQAENLASNGFIVVVPDHTYSTAATVFPDGRVTGLKTPVNLQNLKVMYDTVGKLWVDDIEFLIKQLDRLNSETEKSKLAGAIDTGNIGIAGHSFGGTAAFNALLMSSRVRAAFTMDGTLYPLKEVSEIEKPYMFFTAENYYNQINLFRKKDVTDIDLKEANLSREQYNMLSPVLTAEADIIDALSKKGDVLYIDQTGHFNFTDLQLFSSLVQYTGMTGKINGQRGAEIVNAYMLDFFNFNLKGKAGELLKGPSKQFPEVKFATTPEH